MKLPLVPTFFGLFYVPAYLHWPFPCQATLPPASWFFCTLQLTLHNFLLPGPLYILLSLFSGFYDTISNFLMDISGYFICLKLIFLLKLISSFIIRVNYTISLSTADNYNAPLFPPLPYFCVYNSCSAWLLLLAKYNLH